MLEKKCSRRDLLKSGGAAIGSLSFFDLPELFEELDSKSELMSDKHLLLVHLDGGNDALNTVVPLGEDFYWNGRESISLSKDSLLNLDDEYGLHSSLPTLKRIYETGNLAFLLGVGHSEFESYSHELSLHAWRTLDTIGSSFSSNTEFDWYQSYGVNIQESSSESVSDLVNELNKVSLKSNSVLDIASNTGAFFVHKLRLTGFDTHENQLESHREALKTVNELFSLLEKVTKELDLTTFIFSEFGRSISENQFSGTDHGNAGLALLYGTKVSGGIYGGYERLLVDGQGVLKTIINASDVYKSVSNNWLFGEKFIDICFS